MYGSVRGNRHPGDPSGTMSQLSGANVAIVSRRWGFGRSLADHQPFSVGQPIVGQVGSWPVTTVSAFSRRTGSGLLALTAAATAAVTIGLAASPGLTPIAESAITTTLYVATSVPSALPPANSTGTSTIKPSTLNPVQRSTACLTVADVQTWPVERQAGHVVMVGLNITSSVAAAKLVQRANLGGILIRGVPGADTKKRIAQISAAGIEAPAIAVDEEGGRVQHLKGMVGPLPSARNMAAKFTTAQVQTMARKHAAGMRALGFTMVFAPVLDLNGPAGNGIGDRAFSADPAIVSAYGTAFAAGFSQSGVYPVLKHFPGHGRSSGDTHNQGANTPPLNELRAADMVPFAAVTRAVPVGVMTAHLNVPDSDGLPSSLSPMMTEQILRGDLGFEGMVVTDSLSMWSIRYHFSPPKAAELALRAGADLLLFDDLPQVDSIISALSTAAAIEPWMKERLLEANLRVLRAKGRLCPDAIVRRTAGRSTATASAPSSIPA
jgi:beta-N-acetylhexosaminidase